MFKITIFVSQAPGILGLDKNILFLVGKTHPEFYLQHQDGKKRNQGKKGFQEMKRNTVEICVSFTKKIIRDLFKEP